MTGDLDVVVVVVVVSSGGPGRSGGSSAVEIRNDRQSCNRARSRKKEQGTSCSSAQASPPDLQPDSPRSGQHRSDPYRRTVDSRATSHPYCSTQQAHRSIPNLPTCPALFPFPWTSGWRGQLEAAVEGAAPGSARSGSCCYYRRSWSPAGDEMLLRTTRPEVQYPECRSDRPESGLAVLEDPANEQRPTLEVQRAS